MKRLLDHAYKNGVIGYHSLAEILGTDIGQQLGYVVLVAEAEKLSEKNGTSFWSEYRGLKHAVKDQEKLEQKLNSMERNPSLSLRRLDDYKVGVDFKTNQTKHIYDKFYQDKALSEASREDAKLSPIETGLILLAAGLLYLRFRRTAKMEKT